MVTSNVLERPMPGLEVYLTQGSCKLTASMEQYHETWLFELVCLWENKVGTGLGKAGHRCGIGQPALWPVFWESMQPHSATRINLKLAG